MVILPWHAEGVLHVCENLKTADRLEVFATRNDDDPRNLADSVYYGQNERDLFWLLGTPEHGAVMCLGAHELWPGFWTPWAFGTPDMYHIGLSATRFVKHGMIPEMKRRGFRRAECRSLDTHTQAHAWLEACGGLLEGHHPRMGREGEGFVTYVFFPETC
ncbi:hypothetical protein IB275_30510 [Pseudomonas sp. PDM21]|uniref:hypothetical protein n=1 Tax=Pseudomonas sp. PDM21 TaxID=2769257 RepID=UPI00177B78D9|nr:hypothetical protein [Pseudomonas sp. PDM21]MBD9674949.1 hypothetical protein [Pseudomonas sp. PDM21]